jgi:hypothetical protein
MPEEPPDLHGAPPPPDLLASEEAYDWGAVPNLDQFFTRIYWWAAGLALSIVALQLHAVLPGGWVGGLVAWYALPCRGLYQMVGRYLNWAFQWA